jgi:hypothetical protein
MALMRMEGNEMKWSQERTTWENELQYFDDKCLCYMSWFFGFGNYSRL